MLKADKFTDFVDGEEIEADKALYTTCDICGEWLDYSAHIEYNSVDDSQEIIIQAKSCGETFRLIPILYRMEKICD